MGEKEVLMQEQREESQRVDAVQLPLKMKEQEIDFPPGASELLEGAQPCVDLALVL